MKLEPVYLVAPTPEPEGMSRRGVLGSVLAFAVGAAGGMLGGYWYGARSRPDSLIPDEEYELLVWLAKEAPADHLLDQGMYFLHTYSWKYRDDAVLFEGACRLAEELVSVRRKDLLGTARFAEEVLRSLRDRDATKVDILLESLRELR